MKHYSLSLKETASHPEYTASENNFDFQFSYKLQLLIFSTSVRAAAVDTYVSCIEKLPSGIHITHERKNVPCTPLDTYIATLKA